MNLYTMAGLVGVFAILSVYFANQQDWLDARRWQFPAANLAGSLLILVSLWDAWNLPSVVIEAAWSAISVWGLIRRSWQRQTASAAKRRGAAQQAQPPE